MTHSFPTRRSSDIRDELVAAPAHGLVVDHADADVIRHCGKFLNAGHACGRCVAEWYQGVGFARPRNGWISGVDDPPGNGRPLAAQTDEAAFLRRPNHGRPSASQRYYT